MSAFSMDWSWDVTVPNPIVGMVIIIQKSLRTAWPALVIRLERAAIPLYHITLCACTNLKWG